jgi:hypothetical protein
MTFGRVCAKIALVSVFLPQWLALSGCSGSGQPVIDPVSGPCNGPMSEVAQSCPTTFSGMLDSVACAPSLMLGTFTCEGLTVLIESGGLTGVWCVYDSTTGALVGAQLRTDTNSYCNGASFSQTAGKVPDASCFDHPPPGVRRDCPPASADGGGDLVDTDAVSE